MQGVSTCTYIQSHGFKYFLYPKALTNRLKTAVCFTAKCMHVYVHIYNLYIYQRSITKGKDEKNADLVYVGVAK